MGAESTLREAPPRPRRWILPVIVLSQFAGTSLWFAGNAVMPDFQRDWALSPHALGDLTSAVQLGFIAGTLVFAFLMISDRYSPRRVFFACSVLGAAANLALHAVPRDFAVLLGSRFLTGFFLAGIYPVGMKIAAGWYQKNLGNAIGWLVGALVLGTAFPHGLRAAGHGLSWELVTWAVSGIAIAGGMLMLILVPDGPYLSKGARFDAKALAVVFRSRDFRASSFGYFGHMWELYAFWAFVPVALAAHEGFAAGRVVSFWTFAVIAAGSIGCIVGGLVSVRAGSARVAWAQLLASGACCMVSPLMFHAPTPLYLAFLVFWGVVVVGDSPQFSALNARHAPKELVGSALTIANCIGFAITIVTLQLLNRVSGHIDPAYLYLPLAAGPVFGLYAMRSLMHVRD
ncbi:MAG TPA: MFS transporter [Burkholderiales bacterium]|nr:MFS transporter [Burkholderiales bacterium]